MKSRDSKNQYDIQTLFQKPRVFRGHSHKSTQNSTMLIARHPANIDPLNFFQVECTHPPGRNISAIPCIFEMQNTLQLTVQC